MIVKYQGMRKLFCRDQRGVIRELVPSAAHTE
jgi:hypothetical protein